MSQSMKYAYPDWTDSDIGLLGNWGEIMFLVTSVPATWIVETKGARCLQLLYRDCHTALCPSYQGWRSGLLCLHTAWHGGPVPPVAVPRSSGRWVHFQNSRPHR